MKNTRFVRLILIPSFLVLAIFVAVPLIYGLAISFFDYNPASNHNLFLGFANYKKIFADPIFKKAAYNTIFFGVVGVLANIVITLFLAQIISILPSKAIKSFFRTILFIPCIAPIVGTSVIWKYGILQTDGGMLNQVIKFLGGSPQNWMGTSTLLILIIIYTLWADIGYNIVLFSAGLESVPQEFNEAAMIDGAGAIRRFVSIKLPLIGRSFAFVFIMTMANYFQMFAQFKILAPNGGIANSATVLTTYIYRQSFTKNDMGYASTVAMGLWNDYLNPLIMLNDVDKMTLPLALSYFSNQHSKDINTTMAAGTMIMIPMIIIFVIFQKQFIKGLTLSGMK